MEGVRDAEDAAKRLKKQIYVEEAEGGDEEGGSGEEEGERQMRCRGGPRADAWW